MRVFFGRIAAILAFFAIVAPVGASAETDFISKRKEDFKLMRKNMGDIKNIVEGAAEVKTAAAAATVIAEVAKRIVAKVNFPAGSEEGDTKALPLIWTDPAGFDAKAKALEAASVNLLASANSKNLETIETAFENTAKACGACHDVYRAK